MLKKTGWACSFAFLLVFTSQAITISGTVTNSANNQPVVGAIVTFLTLTGGNIYTDTTVPGGAYTLTGVRNVTTGYLTVTAAGYTTNRELLAGLVATNVIDVQLNPIGIGAGTKNIQGLVTDASANAVSGAQIILLLRGGVGTFTAVDTVQSAANGDYRFDSLASGRYEMAVSKTGFLDTVVTGLNITAVDSLVLAIQLTAVGTRVGTLSGKGDFDRHIGRDCKCKVAAYKNDGHRRHPHHRHARFCFDKRRRRLFHSERCRGYRLQAHCFGRRLCRGHFAEFVQG